MDKTKLQGAMKINSPWSKVTMRPVHMTVLARLTSVSGGLRPNLPAGTFQGAPLLLEKIQLDGQRLAKYFSSLHQDTPHFARKSLYNLVVSCLKLAPRLHHMLKVKVDLKEGRFSA